MAKRRKQPKISSIGNPRMAKRRSQKDVMKIRMFHAKSERNAVEPSRFHQRSESVKSAQSVSVLTVPEQPKSKGIGEQIHVAKTAFNVRGGNADDNR